MLPTYLYGLDLTGACAGQTKPCREPAPQLAILEHRRELEKCLVVRRLRGQVDFGGFVFCEHGCRGHCCRLRRCRAVIVVAAIIVAVLVLLPLLLLLQLLLLLALLLLLLPSAVSLASSVIVLLPNTLVIGLLSRLGSIAV